MLKQMPMGDFFHEQFQFADRFNVLNLTDPELALLTAIMILNPSQYIGQVAGKLGHRVTGTWSVLGRDLPMG